MRFFRRPEEAPDETSDDALYVHLAADGAIFVIRGATGEQLWVDRDGLLRELATMSEQKGLILYSREAGGPRAPTAHRGDVQADPRD